MKGKKVAGIQDAGYKELVKEWLLWQTAVVNCRRSCCGAGCAHEDRTNISIKVCRWRGNMWQYWPSENKQLNITLQHTNCCKTKKNSSSITVVIYGWTKKPTHFYRKKCRMG
jgi:hypothetical protein